MTSPAVRREILLTRVLLAVTAAGVLPPVVQMTAALVAALAASLWSDAMMLASSLAAIACVSYGVFVHQLARTSWLRRLLQEAAVAATLPSSEAAATPSPSLSLAILVPSYKEEARVVRRTLLSAALQTYRRRRLVLLIDDPPRADDLASMQMLAAARRLPAEIDELLRPMRDRCGAALEALGSCEGTATFRETVRLASLMSECAAWFRTLAAPFEQGDHEDRFFARSCLHERAASLEAEATAWRARRGASRWEARQEYARLLATFACDVEAFERKRYANLTCEPNKAMNLNAYLSLLGGCYREVAAGAGAVLERCEPARADIRVPDCELVLLLDADTVVVPQYAERMVAVLTASGNERVAVAQTPYSAFPQAPGELERIAGATTDVQYLLHLGMSWRGAGFWVGANAVARVAALREVAIEGRERGWPVRRFLHDRTVIEDTETTLALRARGWSVVSHGERLAFSATPVDFGALIVQRLRWANGGLTLVPSLVRALGRRASAGEAAMRLHYLVSLGPTSLALLALPFCFIGDAVQAGLLPLMAISYLSLYARDLVRCGYSWHDAVRVYALNLLLIPVNLAGLLLSLRQAITGEKPRFLRTPKVATRTPMPGICVVAQTAMLSFWLVFGAGLAMEGSLVRAALVLTHVALLAYAIARFVGWREAAGDFFDDVRANVPPAETEEQAVAGWAGAPGGQ